MERGRQWTLRDDNAGHHHGTVRLSESPLFLALSWKCSDDEAAKPVGIFRLDLRALLAKGFIRYEPAGVKGDTVRLRVVRRADGAFCIQTNSKGPALVLTGSS
jgi:hypothetical protein